MLNEKFDVSGLCIASPCSVGWASMAGDERKRHCDLCHLNVYNISELTSVEVESLVGINAGRLCVRMFRRADGTVLTRDCPSGLRTVRKRVARFAGATLAAFLGLFSVSFGQKEGEDPIDASRMNILRIENYIKASEITGAITDKWGAVIPNAQIILSIGAQERSATSNGDGNFSFPSLPEGKYRLRVRVRAFRDYQLVNLDVNSRERLELNIKLTLDGIEEEVGVVALEEPQTVVSIKEPVMDLPLIPQKLEKPLP
jgi:hypothetical protein